jgi:hydroxypyruvate isomerase
MNRREFGRNLATAAMASTAWRPPKADASVLSDAAGQVPFKLSVMLWTVFRDLPFAERLENVAQAGYTNVELVDEYRQWSEPEFRHAAQVRRRLGITFDASAGVERSLTNPAEREALLVEVRRMLTVLEKLECPALILLSGDTVPGLSREVQRASCIEGLKRAAELAQARGVTLLVENIDPEENPHYYLTSAAEGLAIVEAVKHPQVRFLYDLYHEQISEGNLIEKLEKHIATIGLVHVADVPGRHQPGTGEINYPNIFKKLVELGYERNVAMEFIPGDNPIRDLKAAREMAMDASSRDTD